MTSHDANNALFLDQIWSLLEVGSRLESETDMDRFHSTAARHVTLSYKNVGGRDLQNRPMSNVCVISHLDV